MPTRKPQRFYCDEMLGRLARYLRAAGYDTLLANGGRQDRELLREAAAQSRRFLTLDRRILEHKAAARVALLLPRGGLDEQAAALGLDWLGRAFSRCLVDNTPLESAGPQARGRAPADANRPGEPIALCPACGRLYWRGSHYRRLRERLERWEAARRDTRRVAGSPRMDTDVHGRDFLPAKHPRPR